MSSVEKESSLCKHGCGRKRAKDRKECYACRGGAARKKLRSNPEDKAEIERLLLKINNMQSDHETVVRGLEEKMTSMIPAENHETVVRGLEEKMALMILEAEKQNTPSEVEAAQEKQIDSLKNRLNTSIKEKKALQERHDALAQALVDKDAIRAERDAIDKNYKELLELESSFYKGRSRTSSTTSDVNLNASTSSLSLSPAKKKYVPEDCTNCGLRIHKRGNRAKGVEYCEGHTE